NLAGRKDGRQRKEQRASEHWTVRDKSGRRQVSDESNGCQDVRGARNERWTIRGESRRNGNIQSERHGRRPSNAQWRKRSKDADYRNPTAPAYAARRWPSSASRRGTATEEQRQQR